MTKTFLNPADAVIAGKLSHSPQAAGVSTKMNNCVYGFLHSDGLFAAIGAQRDIDDLVRKTNANGKMVAAFSLAELPARESLDAFLQKMSRIGVSGFFNVIAVSYMPTADKAVTDYVVAQSPDGLYEWQSQVGWYGFFRGDDSKKLEGVASELVCFLSGK